MLQEYRLRSHMSIKCIVTILAVLLLLDACFLLSSIPWRIPTQITNRQLYQRKTAVAARAESIFYQDPVPAVGTNLTLANSIVDLEKLQEYLNKRKQFQPNATNSSSISNGRRSIVLIKTHKTGSTTLQNILLRYGLFNEYRFAIPLYRASFLWPNRFSKQSVVYNDKIIGEKFDMLVHHARLDKPAMNEIMAGDPFYFTILRDPVTLFFSAYSYYNYDRFCYHLPITEFTKSEFYNRTLEGPCKPSGLPTRNLLSFDLGLQYSEMDNQKSIAKFIRDLDSELDLVLLMEYYDESILLMRKVLGLTFEDILYFQQNSQRPVFSPSIRHDKTLLKQIKEFNNADMLLYDHFERKFEQLLRQHFAPGELTRDMVTFQSMKDAKARLCINRKADRRTLYRTNNTVFIPYGGAIGYLLNDQYKDDIECRTMALPEIQFTRFLQTYK